MKRRKERIPKIMRLFKNPLVFHHFIHCKGLEYFTFSEKYEELFYLWMEEPDLRFGQMLINEGIVEDDPFVWNREEDQWLVKYGYIEPENIYLWGTYGKDGADKYRAWYAEKPVLGTPLTDVEKWTYPDLAGEPDHEIYAIRREWWKKDMPRPEYKFISQLEPDHIENILKLERVAYHDVFDKVLKQKQQ